MIGAEIEELIAEAFNGLMPEQKYELGSRLCDFIDRELLKCAADDIKYRCSVCGGASFVKCGHTAAGTQRFKCRGCGSIRCHLRTGSVLVNTKLDLAVWKRYIPLFIDHVPCRRVAESLGVSAQTAWFMRVRMLEALFPHLPAFQVQEGCGAQVDELYVRESFKGPGRKDWSAIGRDPRRDHAAAGKRGISDEQICVVTAVNDAGEFYFDVACRGALTRESAVRVLTGRILSGAIVNTDRHRSYAGALREIGAAVHNAIPSDEHKGLKKVDTLHSNIRAFLKPFNGVSTRWLHLYLAWFKWLRSFERSEKSATRHMAAGDYLHTWRKVRDAEPMSWRVGTCPA